MTHKSNEREFIVRNMSFSLTIYVCLNLLVESDNLKIPTKFQALSDFAEITLSE